MMFATTCRRPLMVAAESLIPQVRSVVLRIVCGRARPDGATLRAHDGDAFDLRRVHGRDEGLGMSAERTGTEIRRHAVQASIVADRQCLRMKRALMFVCFFGAAIASASTGDEERFRAAFVQVKIGMTRDEVHSLGQTGKRCTDWPHQRPPICGPLHYFSDMRTVETASGTTTVYSYGREEIVYKNGIVILIRR